MNWQLPCGAHPLVPFDHQVAGQSSMLLYDETTVCKPLIPREHFVYQTLPEGLKEFTAEYRGEIEVHLAEKDGFRLLYGLAVNNESSESPCLCHYSWKDIDSHTPAKGLPKGKNEESMYINTSSHKNILPAQDQCLMKVLENDNHKVYTPAKEIDQGDVVVQHPSALNPWGLKNHKRLLEKMRKSEHRHNCIRFMLLRNVVADFKYPCILDLKIGSRLYGDEANLVKVESQSRKCRETTSCSIGVRLCGMQVYQKLTDTYTSLDKYYGRTLKEDTFKMALINFLNNGQRSRIELLQPIISQLAKLIHCLEGVNSYRFYASSLLIIYDGEETVRPFTETGEHHVGVKDSKQRKNGLNVLPQVVEQKSAAVSTKVNDKSYANFITRNETFGDSCACDNVYSKSQGSIYFDTSVHSDVTSSSHIQDDRQNKHLNRHSSVPQTSSIDSSNRNHHHELMSEPLDSQKATVVTKKPSTHAESVQNEAENRESAPELPVVDVTTSSTLCRKVDVKMIDFAHTTHEGFPKDKLRHEGPDLDYIQGLTNLKRLFEEILSVA